MPAYKLKRSLLLNNRVHAPGSIVHMPEGTQPKTAELLAEKSTPEPKAKADAAKADAK